MENALLIGLSRQTALQRQMDVIANNLANVETAGFKAESLKFEELVMPVAEASNPALVGDRQLSYVHDVAVLRDFNEGAMVATGNPLDIAVSGDGWLVVETPDGERYTRNGHLQLDAEGRLVSSEGYPVLGNTGAIRLGPEESDLAFAADGTVSTSDGEKGKLRVVVFADDARLQKQGGSLFASAEPPTPAPNVRIAQGMVEKANVQPVREIARMIEVTRSYIGTQRLLDRTAELRSTAIEQLGRLPG